MTGHSAHDALRWVLARLDAATDGVRAGPAVRRSAAIIRCNARAWHALERDLADVGIAALRSPALGKNQRAYREDLSMKLRLAIGIAAAMVAILIATGTGEADPTLGNVPAHRHFVQSPDGGLVEVGPRVCDNPTLQRAFNQFHNNIHAVTPSGLGPAAPGLHNFKGADLTFGGC